jgi:DNA-binding NtrC family response regulator
MSSPTPFGRLRVLIVEDEALIRMAFEEMLSDLGHDVAGMADRIETAIELARSCECDVAILDVHLGSKPIFPAADLLAQRGIPFILTTGYSGSELPVRFRTRPTMEKPFQPDRLEQLLAEIFGSRSR